MKAFVGLAVTFNCPRRGVLGMTTKSHHHHLQKNVIEPIGSIFML